MRCLDLSIPPGDEDVARQVEILPYRLVIERAAHGQPLEFVGRSSIPAFATPKKPRANHLAAQLDTHRKEGNDGDGISGPGTPTSGTSSAQMKTDAEVEASAKSVWGMIDKSQLAKAIWLDDAKKVGYIPYFLRRSY
jgi:hypothetical protein